MSLSIYDPIKNCFVLRPMKPEIINAFHPDYIKTYMPTLMKGIRRDESRTANGVLNGGKSKATRESANPTVNSISAFPKTKPKDLLYRDVELEKTLTKAEKRERIEAIKRRILQPTEFHVFNKAGMPKMPNSTKA